jgi:SAM-dependent methyltransferase
VLDSLLLNVRYLRTGPRARGRELRWRLAGHYSRPLGNEWIEPLRGARGLEIGGPSPVFGAGGLLPVYPVLATLDGIQVPLARNLWSGEVTEGPYETGQAGLGGRLWLREATDLGSLETDSYDVVLSSHVIEHLANPLRALREWLRVLRPGGHLLTVIPHKEGCADHRRPTTTLGHLVQDELDRVGEDDLTHADEAIRLHDLGRAPLDRPLAAYRERTLANAEFRALHHHVWTTRSALQVLDHVGLEVLELEARWRFDIYVLCRAPAPGDPPPDNAAVLATDTARLRRSPFRADRRGDDGS